MSKLYYFISLSFLPRALYLFGSEAMSSKYGTKCFKPRKCDDGIASEVASESLLNQANKMPEVRQTL